jgi:hypothetical protein
VVLGLALVGLPHCTFPEFDFDEGVGSAGGGGGDIGGMGGRSGSGGGGSPGGQGGSAGQGGSTGAGGADNCPPDCAPFVVAKAQALVISLAADGENAFWTQGTNAQSTDILLSAPLTGGGPVAPLAGEDEIDESMLRGVDDDYVYLISPGFQPNDLFVYDREKSELRAVAPLAGGGLAGPEYTFVGPSSFFFVAFDEAVTADVVFRLPKASFFGAPVPVRVLQHPDGGTYTPLGVDGDALIVVDDFSSQVLRASKDSDADPGNVEAVFADAPNELPFFEWFAADETAYYFASDENFPDYVVSVLPRGKDRFDDLSAISRSERLCSDLSADGESLYWVVGETTRSLRTAPKNGSAGPRTLVDDIGSSGYVARGGFVYWFDPASRELRGLRVR